MNTKLMHEKILYPVVRVRAKDSGGSGVIVYSKEDPKDPGHYINLIMTCQHVIDKLITVKDDWDAVLKLQRKTEFFEEAHCEVFDYDGSRVVSANATQATVLAYDKRHDLAVLRLHNPRQMPYVASIIPEASIKTLNVGDAVHVCGCSLLHDPFPGAGELTYLREVIEQVTYLMASAPSIFGNSGGGLFHDANGHLLGLTTRVTITQLGFGLDVQTWMEFSTHPERLYEFFRRQELQFLYDPSDNYHDAIERRREKQRVALRDMLLGGQAPPTVPTGGQF